MLAMLPPLQTCFFATFPLSPAYAVVLAALVTFALSVAPLFLLPPRAQLAAIARGALLLCSVVSLAWAALHDPRCASRLQRQGLECLVSGMQDENLINHQAPA